MPLRAVLAPQRTRATPLWRKLAGPRSLDNEKGRLLKLTAGHPRAESVLARRHGSRQRKTYFWEAPAWAAGASSLPRLRCSLPPTNT